MVRTRTASDSVRLPVEEGSGVARAPTKHSAAEAAATASDYVEKCVNCHYYDRRRAKPTDGKAPMWGQCRRHSPHLNPVTAKTYVVEGVWPLVRDDDWCGEWKVLTRMIEPLAPEADAYGAADGRAVTASSPAEVPALARD